MKIIIYFSKKIFYAQLERVSRKFIFSEQINTILKNKEEFNITKPSLLLRYIEDEYGNIGKKIAHEFESIVPLFVINQCRTPLDYNLGKSLSQISRNYFGLNAMALGRMSYDDKVWQSVRSMKPLSIDYPNCPVLTDIERIYKSLKSIEKNHNNTYSLAS